MLQNVCVKILLFHAIKGILIYAKNIKELWIRETGKKSKDPPTIHVIIKLEDLVLGIYLTPNYKEPINPIIDVYINNDRIKNTLIDLRASITVMTRETMEWLRLYSREALALL